MISDREVVNGPSNEGSSVEQEESFESLLEKSLAPSGRLEPGQKVKARVISVSGGLVYIDLGGKSDGVVPLDEFRREDGTLSVKDGDEIEAFFISVEEGTRVLTTRVRGYSAAKLSAIRDAFEAGLPVNGDVKREVKGGFEVSVGGVRCFCPFSQIDLKGGREGGIYLGQTFPFKVLEYEEGGRNVIVSRRALLEQERKARLDRLRESLSVGMEVKATVRSVQNFGAFVDLGGVDGLIPASEISWNRAERPSDVLSVGQEVTAKIIALDWDANRLTLSLKATQTDPWANVSGKYSVDGRVNGTVVRLVPFGAFVNLEPGIDGLIHISNLGAGRRIKHPKEVVEVGQTVEVYILEVDETNRKISLSMQPRPKQEKIVLPSEGELLEGNVERVMPYGIFLRINSGLTGLIPNAEMGTPVGTDHNRMFPPGTPIRVIVKEVDKGKGRVRLSRKGVFDKVEHEEFRQYKDTAAKEERGGAGLGTLGDLLRAKMEEKKKGD